ncbi:MAG: hypothetical protein ACLPVY_05045 [Acidimicrobiia bacterium]
MRRPAREPGGPAVPVRIAFLALSASVGAKDGGPEARVAGLILRAARQRAVSVLAGFGLPDGVAVKSIGSA